MRTNTPERKPCAAEKPNSLIITLTCVLQANQCIKDEHPICSWLKNDHRIHVWYIWEHLPSIYPIHVSINLPYDWIRHGIDHSLSENSRFRSLRAMIRDAHPPTIYVYVSHLPARLSGPVLVLDASTSFQNPVSLPIPAGKSVLDEWDHRKIHAMPMRK